MQALDLEYFCIIRLQETSVASDAERPRKASRDILLKSKISA